MLPCRRGAFLPKLASFKKIHENDGKTVPKGTSKIMFFGAKWRHGPPRFDLSSDYWRFGAMPKKHVFGVGHKATKNNSKSSKMRPRAAQWSHRVDRVSHFRVKGPPAGDNYQRNRLNQWEQSRSALSDTPLGTRPGEFILFYYCLYIYM